MNDFFNAIKCGDPKDLSGRVAYFEKNEFPSLGDRCNPSTVSSVAYCYQGCISTCAWQIYLRHFGFRGAIPPQQIVDKGAEMATAYFGVVRDALAELGLQSSPAMNVAWYKPYCEALLLTTLGGRSRERAQCSDCLHPNFAVNPCFAPHGTDPALGDVLLCIASSLQSSPMDSAAIEERLQKSRKKRPKLLFSAFKALESKDRAQFVSALADSTANFAKTTAEDDLPLTAVAVLESILAGLAYERGWTDLVFELPIAARLVTHQSLGLT